MPTFLHELETPSLVVDLDILAQNLDRMAAYCALNGLQLRPHVKTHKSTRVAAEQLRLGAVGLSCATPRELEVMSALTDELLLMHPPVNQRKTIRLMTLPDSVRLTIGLDSLEAMDRLADAARNSERVVGVYVEVDTGMRRVGVQTPLELLALAARASDDDWLRWRGVAFYPGNVRAAGGAIGSMLTELGDRLEQFLEPLEAGGFTPQAVSGGATPIAWRMHEVPGVTEVRPGTYVYNDRTTVELGACDHDDCALTVLATVISTAIPGQAVIDAGSKSLGREPLPSGTGGWGALLERPEVTVSRMSEEHGILDLSGTSWKPKVGDVLRVVPNHVCYVVHLADRIQGVRGTLAETRWDIEARGR